MMNNKPEPEVDALGVPHCAENNCGRYDGKRCRLLGRRPDAICEPAVIELARANSEERLLARQYLPPPLFIYEEVEIGSGYHILAVSTAREERDWSEPFQKSGSAEYRSRVVRVPYPPETHASRAVARAMIAEAALAKERARREREVGELIDAIEDELEQAEARELYQGIPVPDSAFMGGASRRECETTPEEEGRSQSELAAGVPREIRR